VNRLSGSASCSLRSVDGSLRSVSLSLRSVDGSLRSASLSPGSADGALRSASLLPGSVDGALRSAGDMLLFLSFLFYYFLKTGMMFMVLGFCQNNPQSILNV
jgi:hypothetical protein